MDTKKYYPIAGLLLAIVLFQVVVTVSGKEFFLVQITMAAYYSLVIIGLTVLMGYTGQLSLGHAAFFAMGGYTTAVLTTTNLMKMKTSILYKVATALGVTVKTTDIYGAVTLYVSPWVALIIAVIITATVAFIIGIPILKLKGHYLAMATMGFGIIMYRIFLGTSIFGEADGISNVPPFQIFPGLKITGDQSHMVSNYYLAWGIVVVVMILMINLIHSRTGRALRSIHGSEEAAEAMGVDTARYKLMIFVLSAVLAAIGGVLLTHFNASVNPVEASVMKSVRYVAIVAIGGMANLWGALIMSVFLNFLSLRGYLGSYDDAFFGTVLILIMLFFPDGLINKETLEKFLKKVKALFGQRLKGDEK
jgi:branched-chain amino acid transport system permease protein